MTDTVKQTKKSAQKNMRKLGPAMDPFLVLGIFVLFAIPVVTIINLTPGHKPPVQQNRVLGTTDQTNVTVVANTVAANGLLVEKMTQNSENSYTLYVQSLAHEMGEYTNTLCTLSNGTNEDKQVHVTSNFESVAPGTEVAIVVDSVKFIVLAEDGTTFPPTLYLAPGDMMTVEIQIESPSDVNFTTGFSLDLTIE